MTKNAKVLKAGLGYTIGNYMLKGISFISIPIYTRLLSTSDYGRFNNFLTYEGIFFVFVGFAIHSSYKSARYKYKLVSENAVPGKDYYSYASATILFVLICTLAWLILFNIFEIQLSRLLGLDRFSINLLVVYSASMALITCFNTDVGIDYEYRKFLLVSGFNAIGTVIISVLLLVTAFSGKRYMGMIIGASVPSILAAIYIIFYFFKRARPNNLWDFLKWGIVYSLPIVPHGLSQVVLNQFDRIMITKMVSVAATGVYSFAYNIYSILAVTFNSLDNVWSPWFYEQMRAKRFHEIKKISSIYILLMFIFSSGVILISPEIVFILGEKNYWVAKYTAIPVVAGGFFAFMYTVPAAVEYYHEKTVWIAIGTTAAAIINILLNYIFIPKIGYIAAAYATLVTYILYFFFHFFIAKKIQGLNLFSTKVILSCSVGILVISLITRMLINIMWIRWSIALLITVCSILYEENKYGYIVSKIIELLNRRENK